MSPRAKETIWKVCEPLCAGYSKREVAAQLGLPPQAPAWRLGELRHEIVTGEAVITIRAAADRLGISDSTARSLALKLGLRLVGFPAMILADDFERLAALADSRAPLSGAAMLSERSR